MGWQDDGLSPEYESLRKEKPLILVQEGKLTIFRGISIDDWLSLIMQYAFVLTKRGLYGIASEVLRHIRLSVVFQDVEYQDALRLALIGKLFQFRCHDLFSYLLACAMRNRDHETIVEQCRAMMNVYQFNNEPLRIILVALGNGLHATESLIHPNFQKHLYRELKMSDAIAHGKEIKWNSARQRYVLADEKEDEGDADSQIAPSKKEKEVKSRPRVPIQKKPTKPNPLHLSLYGMLCTAAKSYQSGLCESGFTYDSI
jgi:general transcription factor 3C polypeptide 3 (transcription factor C subunit 4)